MNARIDKKKKLKKLPQKTPRSNVPAGNGSRAAATKSQKPLHPPTQRGEKRRKKKKRSISPLCFFSRVCACGVGVPLPPPPTIFPDLTEDEGGKKERKRNVGNRLEERRL